MGYRVGTRVRKVSGKRSIGVTGIVSAGPTSDGLEMFGPYDMFVLVHEPWIGANGAPQPADTVALTISGQWEPIIPNGARACDENFACSLREWIEGAREEESESELELEEA